MKKYVGMEKESTDLESNEKQKKQNNFKHIEKPPLKVGLFMLNLIFDNENKSGVLCSFLDNSIFH